MKKTLIIIPVAILICIMYALFFPLWNTTTWFQEDANFKMMDSATHQCRSILSEEITCSNKDCHICHPYTWRWIIRTDRLLNRDSNNE